MRVVVTAIGIVSPLAVGADRTFRALISGERAFGPVTLFDIADYRARIAAEVKDLDIRGGLGGEVLPRVDAMAVLAAREALDFARLPAGDPIDLVFGGTQGGMLETELHLVAMHLHPASRAPHSALLAHPISATVDRLRASVAPFRRARTISSACASGASAIAIAAGWIRSGRSTRVLAGGAEALCRFSFAGFNLLFALDPEPCRPFDRKRAGMSLGEGAAFLLLESEDAARARGAEPIAELSGWALGSEAKHITLPDETGRTPARLLREALARSGLRPEEIGYINAHGTGTPSSDAMEALALREALGSAIDNKDNNKNNNKDNNKNTKIPVSSCKGQIGHALGAASAIEAAVTVLALARRQIPPTGGLVEPDPRCDLFHVMGTGREHAFDAALSSSFGVGGAGAVLAFTRPGIFAPPSEIPAQKIVITAAATLGPLGVGGAEPTLEYLNPGDMPLPGPSVIPPDRALDPDKSRRYDGAATRVVVTAGEALRLAGPGVLADPARIGVVVGLAFRGGDVGAAFLAPILSEGWKKGKPIVFPNLLPSSPASYASIYYGLEGPSLAVLELSASGGGALSTAVDLLLAGDAGAVLACSFSEHDALSNAAVSPVCLGSHQWADPRTDGAGALLVELTDFAALRGAEPLAEIAAIHSGPLLTIPDLPAPQNPDRARVFIPRPDVNAAQILAGTPWSEISPIALSARAGAHEALGGAALAAAALAIARGLADEVLVIDEADHRLEIFVLVAPARSAPTGL